MAKKSKTPVARKAAAPKAATPMSRKEWGPIKKKLLEMREDLLRTVQKKQEMDVTPQEVGDEADQATSSLEKEMLFELSDNERTMLDQIEGALRKMEKGSYSLCESCQKPITKLRIKAIPFARYCISCQGSAESAVV
ncbi:MAG: TraR/DksA family transcriptional regulator [Elusimicrobia bacterium]|nr:TraR/DksA family transcriptional regulator [Elusimicrobiota bacterium]